MLKIVVGHSGQRWRRYIYFTTSAMVLLLTLTPTVHHSRHHGSESRQSSIIPGIAETAEVKGALPYLVSAPAKKCG